MQKNLFDPQRALLAGKPVFKPFYVKRLDALSAHIQNGAIANDADLLVTERPNGVIALDTRQIAYYHVAQGEMNDEPYLGELYLSEPWLVTF